ncbi:acid phosphatase [Propionivibrio dicarboxylicus]|uniref:Acid phosphatase n=1 Tax=Propionivibrio dicarboxylicus TaxID=83767 RepID=A0A1G8E1L1_9RHOO|nr:phosphatase PAP2 family protein [Propionivibrio dicarboxylicus]SDH63836.1 acid phosphatase (class A) [Propionivibrio dicarboxylicus]
MKTSTLRWLTIATLLFAGCAELPPSTTPKSLPGGRPDHVIGYLQPDRIPDSRTFLPAPPTQDSAAFAADEAAYRRTRTLRDTPRWTLAQADAELRFPQAAGAFSCALGQTISVQETPHLAALLSRLRADVALTGAGAKKHFQRQRPYLAHGDTSCTPEEKHKADSFPSSHAAIGWAWALMLAELAPERRDVLLKRGLAFGDSRVICGVHWQSDVDAGRLVGAAAFSLLHAEAEFVRQMRFAAREIRPPQAGQAPTAECATELGTLDITPR